MAKEDVAVQAFVGVGLPELLHASVGYVPTTSLALELTLHNVIFNTMLGAGATYHMAFPWLDQPEGHNMPRHAILWSAHAAVNLQQPGFAGGGEIIGSGLFLQTGYGFVSDVGFSVRAKLGALLYVDDGQLAGGPLLGIALGWSL